MNKAPLFHFSLICNELFKTPLRINKIVIKSFRSCAIQFENIQEDKVLRKIVRISFNSVPTGRPWSQNFTNPFFLFNRHFFFLCSTDKFQFLFPIYVFSAVLKFQLFLLLFVCPQILCYLKTVIRYSLF
jgi:hypothetical protein